MNFDLTSEQQAVRGMAREWALAEVAPVIHHFDETHEFPHEIVRSLGKTGLLGALVPEEYGGAALDYVGSIGKPRIQAHEKSLVTYAHERLGEINSIRIFGHARDKGAIVSFEMKGAHPHDVATIIDRSGVAVRAGTHCVMPLLARFGVTATCRASFALYNTKAEVDRLAEALIKAQQFFA